MYLVHGNYVSDRASMPTCIDRPSDVSGFVGRVGQGERSRTLSENGVEEIQTMPVRLSVQRC